MPNTKLSTENDFLITDNGLLFWDHENKGRMLVLKQDPEPADPRQECDNAATMACFHRRHSLGDELAEKTPGEFWDAFLRKNMDDGALLAKLQQHEIKGFDGLMADEGAGWENPEDVLDLFHSSVEDGRIGLAMAALEDRAAWLPMYLYEHSGMTVSCGERKYPYNDQWDSSEIGWIVMSKETAVKELGAGEDDWKEKAEACMKAEVESYDNYLTGDVWYYTLYESALPVGENENGVVVKTGKPVSGEDAWEEKDSCGGFEGSYLIKSGIPENVGDGLQEALESGNYWTGTAEPRQMTVWSYVRDE